MNMISISVRIYNMGATVPEGENSRERKFHGEKFPGSKLARVLFKLLLQGAKKL